MASGTDPSDRQLVADILSGSRPEGFELLVDRYTNLVHSVAYRLTRDATEAEDIAQEAFLRAYRFLSTYKPEYKFSTWIVRIVYNLFRDRFKKKRVTIVREVDSPEDSKDLAERFADPKARPDEIAEKSARAGALLDIVNGLPENYRSILVLYFWREQSYEEIAEIMDIPVGTVKSRLNRAKVFLVERSGQSLEKWV